MPSLFGDSPSVFFPPYTFTAFCIFVCLCRLRYNHICIIHICVHILFVLQILFHIMHYFSQLAFPIQKYFIENLANGNMTAQ